jgi:hypothetical protein
MPHTAKARTAKAGAKASRPGRVSRGVVAQAEQVSGADAVQAIKARLARDSFSVVSNPRRRRLRNGDGSFHCDYRTVDELRQISRWQEYHAGTYGGLLSTWATYLGAPTWTPGTSDPTWNEAAAKVIAVDLKAKKHDVRRRFGWDQYVRLLAIGLARDGQVGLAHTVYGAAQLIEAERIVDVETNGVGAIINWKIAPLKGGHLDLQNQVPVSAAMVDVLQILTRASQTFGLPVCFSTLDDHDGIADLWQAEIDSAAESARPWLMAEEKDGALGLPGGVTIPDALGATAQSTSTIRGSGGRDSAEMGWVRTVNGNIIGAPKGITLKPHQPGRPNTDVPEFSKAMLRIVCMALIPYELAFLDQAGINMSNGRGIVRVGNLMLDAFRRTHLNAPLARQAHGLLRAAMAEGRLPVNKEFQLGDWEWPSIPEHDRLKERQADAADRANGTANLKDLVGEQWKPKCDQRALELGHAADLVGKHNAKYPAAPITISDILGDPAKTAQMAVQIAQMQGNSTVESQPLTSKPLQREPVPA